MRWREYVSREDQEYIEENHGTTRFKQIAGFALNQVAFHQIKRRLPPEQHQSFSKGWQGSSRARQEVDDKITDLLADLDNRLGGHGQRGAAWLDLKVREMVRFVQLRFE